MSNHSQQMVQKLWSYCNVLRDDSLESSENLPDPDVIAAEVAEDLRAALEQFEAIQGDAGHESF